MIMQMKGARPLYSANVENHEFSCDHIHRWFNADYSAKTINQNKIYSLGPNSEIS